MAEGYVGCNSLLAGVDGFCRNPESPSLIVNVNVNDKVKATIETTILVAILRRLYSAMSSCLCRSDVGNRSN